MGLQDGLVNHYTIMGGKIIHIFIDSKTIFKFICLVSNKETFIGHSVRIKLATAVKICDPSLLSIVTLVFSLFL